MQISVIVPVRNEENSINALLDGLLLQTRAPDEIVITDGGSTDATASIIQNYIDGGTPIQLIRSGPALPGKGRNLAAQSASYEWLAFIDAGIRPEPTWLGTLAARVAETEQAEVVYGSYEPVVDTLFKECAAIAYVPPAGETDEGMFRAGSIVSALMKRSVWEEVGGFPEHLRSAEDLLFMSKIAAAEKHTVYAPQAVVHWNLQASIWKTFQRFKIYARSNIQAGLWRQWQAAIFRRYALLVLTALPSFWLGWTWLLVTLLLWLLMLMARAVVAIWRNRRCYPANPGRNLLRLPLLVIIIAVLDAAAISGSVQWLFRDKLNPQKKASGLSDAI